MLIFGSHVKLPDGISDLTDLASSRILVATEHSPFIVSHTHRIGSMRKLAGNSYVIAKARVPGNKTP